jgi:hypothetical protein
VDALEENLSMITSRVLVDLNAMSSPLAVNLLLLAAHLDSCEPSQAAALSREYRSVLGEIQSQFRVKTVNPLDEIAKRRTRRASSSA